MVTVNKREFIKLWQKLKPTIIVTPIHEDNSINIHKHFMLMLYFYTQDPIENNSSTQFIKYIGRIIKAPDITLVEVGEAIRALRDYLFASLQKGFMESKNEIVPLNVEELAPVFKPIAKTNTLFFYSLAEFIEEVKANKFRNLSMQQDEIKFREYYRDYFCKEII